jgi:hypothetical protein
MISVRSRSEGTLAIVIDVGAGCGGRDGTAGRAGPARTAKSCGPDTAVLVSSSRRKAIFGRSDGGKKAVHRGEREVAAQTTAQGRPECSPLNLYARVRSFFTWTCTRDRGCSAHPVFPAPSGYRGTRLLQNLGRDPRRGMHLRVGSRRRMARRGNVRPKNQE